MHSTKIWLDETPNTTLVVRILGRVIDPEKLEHVSVMFGHRDS
jgi:hypothetical protein